MFFLMKIKTITSHDVYNFGASLQSYALKRYLSDLGHDVEIINYKPSYLNYNLWFIGPRWDKNIFLKLIFYAYVVPKRILQYRSRRKFNKFTKEFLNPSLRIYSSIVDLKKDVPQAEIYFAGSDQIWNTYTLNGNDPSFYLEFAPDNSIKASYAASFSTSNINPNSAYQVQEWLSKLDYISVRESSGVEILKKIGFNNSYVVVDPVFLLNKNTWTKIAETPTIKDKYLLVYDQENNKYIKKTALALAKKYKLKIVAIENLYPMLYANKRIKNAGPRDFLGLIENCEICLTNSFHCIAFSLIFNKDFLLFPRTHQKVNSRMFDLLSSINLSNRIVKNKTLSCIPPTINYSDVINKINANIIFSKDYIHKVITSKEVNE
jgi:hypothetical protein